MANQEYLQRLRASPIVEWNDGSSPPFRDSDPKGRLVEKGGSGA